MVNGKIFGTRSGSSVKILVAENISDRGLEVFRQNGWEVMYLPNSGRTLEEEIVDAHGLIIRSTTRITGELLERARKLQIIGRAGVGVDNIELEAATKKGILVMNTPGGNAVSVAEHAMALLMALARDIPKADALLKTGKWAKKKLTGTELRGKILGLIGLGRVGVEVVKRASAFGMKILAFDPYVSPRVAKDVEADLIPLDELLARSDFISLHAAYSPETHHLINHSTLEKVKPGLRIVNCGRGELIDEADLLAALESGQVAGAGLDVFESEPPPPSSVGAKLVVHPRVVATPHIAGSTEEAQELVGIRIAEQIRDYLREGVSRNALNLPSVSAEEFRRLEPYVQLAEKLGSFVAQMANERINSVCISYDGGLAHVNTLTVRNSVLAGVLNMALSEKANLINAGAIAEDRGLEMEELHSTRRVSFANSLGVSLRTEGGTHSILGMVGMGGSLRILGINDIDVEAPLKGMILLIKNQDVPGVIGRVGSILGNHRINIANFALGRAEGTEQAIGVVNVDEAISESVLEEIRAVPAVRTARVIQV